MVLVAESGQGACCPSIFSSYVFSLRVVASRTRLPVVTSSIDTAIKVTLHLLVLGKKKVWLMEKMIGNRKRLESNGLFSSAAHIPLDKCFTVPSSSPSHF